MFVEFFCECGQKFRTKIEHAGKEVTCPKCDTKLVVPFPAEQKPAARKSQVVNPQKTMVAIPNSKSSSKMPSKRKPVPVDDDEDEIYEAEVVENEDEDDEDDFSPPKKVKNRRPVQRAVQKTSQKKCLASSSTMETKKSGKSVKGKANAKTTKEDNSRLVMILVGSISAGVLLLVGVGILVLPMLMKSGAEVGNAAAAANAAKNVVAMDLEPFRSDNFFFHCQLPKGWTVTSGGGTGNVPPWIRAEQGNVKISYRASPSGTALSSNSDNTASDPNDKEIDELMAVHQMHLYHGEKLKHEMHGYQEVGEIEKLMISQMEARLSKFTADGSYGGKIYALRVTLIESQWQWNLICQCPSQKEFNKYEPLFRSVATNALK